ncbi:MAG: hypothetical protein H7A55_08075 [Verrucomicrobiaceae bacterium]|nr:hypothetical protein [Verrucomicrobiaceae bacterium]
MTTQDCFAVSTALTQLKSALASMKGGPQADDPGQKAWKSLRASLRIAVTELVTVQAREAKRQKRRAERRHRLEMENEEEVP